MEIPAIGTKSERLTAELAKQEQVTALAAHRPLTVRSPSLRTPWQHSYQLAPMWPITHASHTSVEPNPLALVLTRCWKACETASRAKWRRSRGSCRRVLGRAMRRCSETVGCRLIAEMLCRLHELQQDDGTLQIGPWRSGAGHNTAHVCPILPLSAS